MLAVVKFLRLNETSKTLQIKRHMYTALKQLLCYSLLTLSLQAIVPLNTFAETPLRFVFQKQKDPILLKASAERVAHHLQSRLHRQVEVQVPANYSASVQALVSKTADVAYMSSLPFLLARRDGGAKLLLAEQRVDPNGISRTNYDSVLVARADSPLTSFEDVVKSASSLSMVFTSPTSTSGFIFPFSRFVDAGLLAPGDDPKKAFKQVSFGGGYTQAVLQVLQGKGDVAAVSYYVVEGPKAETYLSDEQRKQLKIVARIPGVPTHVIATRGDMSEEERDQIKKALLSLAAEKPEVLDDVYGTASFVEVNEDGHVMRTAQAVERLKLPIHSLMPQTKK